VGTHRNDLQALEGRQPVSTNTLQVRDEKDQHLLQTALTGNADFLVSGDKDVQALAGHLELG